MSNRSKQFTSAREIDDFFRQFDQGGFVSWFNHNVAGKDYLKNFKIKNNEGWTKVWSNASILFGKSSINLIEFLSINTIIINETGGTYIPKSEIVGLKGHDGIAYAFDKISGTKLGYNTLNTNKTALNLFNDSKYKLAHSGKPFGNILKDTTDVRWGTDTFPQGFSGNTTKELSKDPSINSFLSEADFMKFRGRGFIQTTGRNIYKEIVKYIISYNGGNTLINNIKSEWSKYGNDLDTICSVSTNQQWDDLFQKTDSIIANFAVYSHSLLGGKYNIIDPNQSDSGLERSIKNVASKIAGRGAKDYIDAFYGRVMQQLSLIDKTPPDNTSNDAQQPQQSLTTPPPSSGQDTGREERTGQDPNSTNQNQQQGKKTPGISNIFGPSLSPSPITFETNTKTPTEDNEMVKGTGFLPFIWYNGYQIDTDDIDYFSLYNDGMLPSIKLVFGDPLNLLSDKSFPLDDSKIKLFLNPRTTQLKPILMEFKIKKFSFNGNVYSMTGTIDANLLYIKRFKSYPKMTSYNVLQTISKEIGLGFNSNITDTADSMTWLNTGSRTYEFLDQIVDTSYKSDNAFIISYIDFYYNFNYIDIEKEINKNIDEELGVSSDGLNEVSDIKNKDLISRLLLTNDNSQSETSSHFKSYKVINNSTSVSLESGYISKINYYDNNNKDFLVFNIDSITSQGDKSIILKGAPQDETFYKENVNLVYMGKMDTDNSHKNYKYSYVQNNKNIYDLQKIGLEISMSNPNYNLYRFQKIKVIIVNSTTTPAADLKNNRLSGDWLITDIKYNYTDKVFTQMISLIKRELDLSTEELSKETPQVAKTNAQQTEQTTNPEPKIDPDRQAEIDEQDRLENEKLDKESSDKLLKEQAILNNISK
jgi:hypothetical protein